MNSRHVRIIRLSVLRKYRPESQDAEQEETEQGSTETSSTHADEERAKVVRRVQSEQLSDPDPVVETHAADEQTETEVANNEDGNTESTPDVADAQDSQASGAAASSYAMSSSTGAAPVNGE